MAINQDTLELLALAQDYQSRVFMIILVIILTIFVYFYSSRMESTKDWQLLRNYFLKTTSMIMIVLILLWSSIFLSNGYTLELMLNTIVDFYLIAMGVSVIIIFVWFKDMIMELFSLMNKKWGSKKMQFFGRLR